MIRSWELRFHHALKSWPDKKYRHVFINLMDFQAKSQIAGNVLRQMPIPNLLARAAIVYIKCRAILMNSLLDVVNEWGLKAIQIHYQNNSIVVITAKKGNMAFDDKFISPMQDQRKSRSERRQTDSIHMLEDSVRPGSDAWGPDICENGQRYFWQDAVSVQALRALDPTMSLDSGNESINNPFISEPPVGGFRRKHSQNNRRIL